MNGYKLVYGPEQGPHLKQAEKTRGTDVRYLLGVVINKDGVVTALIWDSPAFKAGLDVSTEIEAVNSEACRRTGSRQRSSRRRARSCRST